MDDGAECALVETSGATSAEARCGVTARAPLIRCERGSQRRSAPSTERRRQSAYVPPAGITHDAQRRVREQLVAGGATRCPDKSQQAIDDTGVQGGRSHATNSLSVSSFLSSLFLGRIRELDAFGPTPEAVEIVEASGFVGKHVDDEVEAVDEDPFTVVVPLHV